jgi:hypothetical protein
MRTLLLPILISAAAPVLAQAPSAAPTVNAADPQSVALARAIVLKMVPDGTYRRLMRGPMDQMMQGMTGQMLNLPVRQFLAGTDVPEDRITALQDTTTREIMTILDPAFEQRMNLIMSSMMAGMGDVLSRFEPQLREGMAQAYVHNFTRPQLEEIDRFFSTPAGTAFAQRTMTLMSDPAVQASMKGLMPELMKVLPSATEKAQQAAASLPKAKTYDDLNEADRARLAKLLGVDPAAL